MKQVIFICDLFYGDHIGGAELHDKVVYDRFEAEGFLFDKKRCSEITVDYVMENRDKLWFISNFVSLSEQAKAVLYSNCEYIIYEHDYKFLDCRNPINFPDFKAPEHHLINYNFYKKAKYVVCLCNRHKEIFNKNLTKQMLGKTLFHELFHIIVTLNNFPVLNYGEERVASLTEQYYTILKSNPTLKNLIVRCMKDG